MRPGKDADWTTHQGGKVISWEAVIVSVLMDLRDEMKLMRRDLEQLNSSIQCRNFQRVPKKLDRIGLAADKLVAHLINKE